VADHLERDERWLRDLDEQAERLTEAGEEYRSIPVPDAIDLYIERGIREGKRRLRIRSGWRYGGISAAAVLLVFVLGLRISPALANAVSQIPGMEYFVNLVRFDKGLELALENEYIQPVGSFDEHDGVRLTIEGVIADAHRMEIFFSVRSLENAELEVTGVSAIDADTGQTLRTVFMDRRAQGRVGVYFMKDEPLPDRVALEVGVKTYPVASADGPPLKPKATPVLPERWSGAYPLPDGIWSVEFDLDHGIFRDMQQIYELDETIEAQGQRITLKRAVVHPIGVSLEVEVDPDNTMEIFHLDLNDLRLFNEKGESYRAYMRYDGNYYFESPYFAMPKELYIEGRRIRAIDKDQLEVELDMESRSLVRRPDDRLELADVIEHEDAYELLFRVHQDQDDMSIHNIFDSRFRDSGGNEYESTLHSYAARDASEPFTIIHYMIPKLPYEGNLILPLIGYPNFIEAPFRIQIK